jgi:preprotein translocase subunit SecB
MSPEIPPAQFRFVRYWVDKAIFKELPRETPKDGEQKPERIPTQIVINVGAGVHEDLKRGQLTLEAKVTPDPKWRPYEIEVAVTGQFEAASDEVTSEQLNMFFRMNVPIILFPYVREVVHRITSDGRYGQVKIDPMNLQLPLESWKPVESGEKKDDA